MTKSVDQIADKILDDPSTAIQDGLLAHFNNPEVNGWQQERRLDREWFDFRAHAKEFPRKKKTDGKV